MDKNLYNQLQQLYFSLIDKYKHQYEYTFKDNYIFYNEEYFFLNDNRDLFRKIQDSKLKLKDIYDENYLKDKDLLQKNLIIFEGEKINFVSDYFHIILLHYILYKLKDAIEEFIRELYFALKNPMYRCGNLEQDEKGNIIFQSQDIFSDWIKQIISINKEIEMLIHFLKEAEIIFSLSESKLYIDKKWLEDVMREIKQNYNFEKLDKIILG